MKPQSGRAVTNYPKLSVSILAHLWIPANSSYFVAREIQIWNRGLSWTAYCICISHPSRREGTDDLKPVTKLLTEISRFVGRLQVKGPRTSGFANNDSLPIFISRSSSIQEADNDEAITPDIAGVEAATEEVEKYLKEDVLPDRFWSLHWSQLLSVGEIKSP